ncbi:MAG: DsrE family protein [Pseudomonadota bacterium]|nr:DsrE family protein [Pseudomonadota bacterium]
MKQFAILLAVSPDGGTLPLRALETLKAALSRGHAVFCFLYEDGVLFADKTRDVPQGETDPSRRLAELTTLESCDVVACVTAAERRGIREELLIDGIRLGGLGEWTEQLQSSDRLVQFR